MNQHHLDPPSRSEWRAIIAITIMVFVMIGYAIYADEANAATAKRGTVAYCKARSSGMVERACIIRVVFAPVGQSRRAVRIAYCESTLRPWATNGIYWGMFQVSPHWRATLSGYGPTAEQQARHALKVYRVTGYTWRHWSCAY